MPITMISSNHVQTHSMSLVNVSKVQHDQQHHHHHPLSDTDTACSSSICSSEDNYSHNSHYYDSHNAQPRESRNARRNRLWRDRKAKAMGKQQRQQKQERQQQQLLDSIVPLHLQSRILAMDCEMVGVGQDGLDSCLARATIVDFDGRIVYDEFVQPSQPVTDYRTYVSGIRAEDLQNAIDLETCRAQVAALLQNDCILVGHALRNDLYALGLRHAWQETRDTAKYEPFMKHLHEGDPTWWPKKLRELVQEHLDYDIQLPGKPHSAYEDAVAALNLYKKHWRKWEKVMDYKIQRTQAIVSSSAAQS